MEAATATERVDAVRAFNRFYTRIIGVLGEGLLRTPYSLTEARVIFELAQHDAVELGDLRRALDIDAGYLSRIIARFESDGVLARRRSSLDGRRQVVALTDQGRAAFAVLDARSGEEIGRLLAPLSDADQRRLVGAMDTIREVLDGSRRPEPGAVVLRAPYPGDLGWVVQRHGALYASEYGWDQTFEALVARIVADYVDHHDPRRERAWIAEVDGQPVGCVFCVRCVRKDEEVAQLRMLLVEPAFRGRGVGRRLVDECLRFAARAGYRRITLWTHDVQVEARRLYERAGFRIDDRTPHPSFGQDLVDENWSRAL